MNYVHHYHYHVFWLDVASWSTTHFHKKHPPKELEPVYCEFSHAAGVLRLETAFKRPDIHEDTVIQLSPEVIKDLENQMQQWLNDKDNWKILADPEFFKDFKPNGRSYSVHKRYWKSAVYGSGSVLTSVAKLIRECEQPPEDIWKCCQRRPV
jgi:hypothetical protein